jgi:hypothetical protein
VLARAFGPSLVSFMLEVNPDIYAGDEVIHVHPLVDEQHA